MAEGATGIRAGRAYVELGVNDKIAAGLRKAGQRLQAFGGTVRAAGKGLLAIGGAATGALAIAAKAFSDMGSELHDMSQRTGVSVEALSELGYAAGQTGASMESVETSLKKMQRSITDAAGGSKEAKKHLADLGLSIADLQGLNPEAQFKKIAEQLNKVADPTQKAAAAMEIFGRSGTDLLPMIGEMDALRKRAEELGIVMSTKDADAADKFGDTVGDLTTQFKTFGFTIGATVAQALQPYAEEATVIASKVIEWAKANRPLILTVAKVAAVATAAGAGLIAFGAAMDVVGKGLTLAAPFTKILGTALSAMVSPVGLVAVGLAAAGAAFLVFSGKGSDALKFLQTRFNDLRQDAADALDGIKTALAGGDFGKAAAVAWSLMKLEWVKGVAFLNGIWLKFKEQFLTVAYGAFYGVQAVFEEVSNAIATTWIDTIATLKSAWISFATVAKSVWQGVQQNYASGVLSMLEATGKLTKAQTDSMRAAFAASAAANDQANAQDAAGQLGGVEQGRADRLAAAAETHAQAMAAIGKSFNDAKAELARQGAEDVARAMEDLQRAQEEFNAAVKQGRGVTPTRLTEPGQGALLAGIEAAATKLSSVGSFSAAGAFGLGGSPTDRWLEKIERNTRNNGRPKFS